MRVVVIFLVYGENEGVFVIVALFRAASFVCRKIQGDWYFHLIPKRCPLYVGKAIFFVLTTAVFRVGILCT